MTSLGDGIAHRTQLVMSIATFDELYMRAQIPPRPSLDAGARALRRALTWSEVAGAQVRVSCDPAALDFIREAAPEIAQRWPAVFGGVDVPRGVVVAQLAEAIGQMVAGLVVERDGTVRLAFESGAALLIGADGALEWSA